METFNKPTLITITAPTCSGKNHLVNILEARFGFSKIISATTRAPRPAEKADVDYQFLTRSKFEHLLSCNQFVEVNEFNNELYGVQKNEFKTKVNSSNYPVIILDPNGIEEFRFVCQNNNLDIFTIYVSTVESLRIERLVRRTIAEVAQTKNVEVAVASHMKRYASMIGADRRWSNTNVWDAIVPGDNIEEAIKMINLGIVWRNHRNATTLASKRTRFVP